MRLIDIAGIGAGFSAAIILGLTLGIFFAKQTGNGLWMIGGLALGFIVGGVTMGRRFSSLIRADAPTESAVTIKVEEGSLSVDGNRQGDATGIALHAYFARKRTVGVRVAIFICVCALLASIFGVKLGVDVLLGGTCGIANMLLVMQHNETLLDRGRGVPLHLAWGGLRMIGFAALAAVVTIWSPWWAMGLFFIGFFAPLAFYAIQLRSEIKREASCTNR